MTKLTSSFEESALTSVAASAEERRRRQQVLSGAPAEISAQGVTYSTRLFDISLHGVVVQRPAAWRDGAGGQFTLRIHLDTGATIRIQLATAQDAAGRLGFHCQDIDIESVCHLRRSAELHLDDPDLLERELPVLLASVV